MKKYHGRLAGETSVTQVVQRPHFRINPHDRRFPIVWRNRNSVSSTLHSPAWVEPGLGPCVGIGAKLPSGIMIELVRGDLGGPLYALYVDGDVDLREAMSEFLNVTGLDPTAVRWRSPYA